MTRINSLLKIWMALIFAATFIFSATLVSAEMEPRPPAIDEVDFAFAKSLKDRETNLSQKEARLKERHDKKHTAHNSSRQAIALLATTAAMLRTLLRPSATCQ